MHRCSVRSVRRRARTKPSGARTACPRCARPSLGRRCAWCLPSSAHDLLLGLVVLTADRRDQHAPSCPRTHARAPAEGRMHPDARKPTSLQRAHRGAHLQDPSPPSRSLGPSWTRGRCRPRALQSTSRTTYDSQFHGDCHMKTCRLASQCARGKLPWGRCEMSHFCVAPTAKAPTRPTTNEQALAPPSAPGYAQHRADSRGTFELAGRRRARGARLVDWYAHRSELMGRTRAWWGRDQPAFHERHGWQG